ncbi:MAG TPA: cytochrome c3 family protein [Pseudomonadales bacterium]|nr:cytochrome c3 family protein [Pseudomonadales bacterium]
MRILIREVRRSAGDSFEYSDSAFEGDIVSIGRAADQIIHLRDRQLALSHSEMRADGKSLAIKAVGEEAFFLNGKRTRSGRLNIGDVVEFGGYSITMREAPADYDYAVDVEAGEVSGKEVAFGSQFRQSLEASGLSKRMWSWVFVVVVLVGLLFVPLIGMVDRDVGIAMRNIPGVPDDGVWLSGPLHPSHQFMGDDCTACHVEAFTMTRDQECIACHTSVTHHVDVAVHDMPGLEEQRCASCHKEHNEPSVLSRSDQGLCSDCHADLESVPGVGRVVVANASDFEFDHPEFKASLLRGEGTGEAMEWRIERVALDDPGIEERSNLIFPHDVHLAAAGIDGPAGEVVMECSDCHRPEPGGAYMEPVTMERHCADCHLLTFDPDAPTRELPHGEPELVVRLLEEYYAREVLVGDGAAPGRPLRSARRPGQVSALTAAQRDAGIDKALSQAQRAAEDVFERTTCKICHEIVKVDDPDRASPWQVQPVRLAKVWMPKGWFDHQAHVAEDCARCHGAENSTVATDVLMPGIESCRDCHGGGEATNKLASDCVECHVFHLPGLGLMRPEVRGAELRQGQSDLDRMRQDRVDQLTPVRAK